MFLIVRRSLLFKGSDHVQKNVTASLYMYFQDAIAQTGGWGIFPESCHLLYNMCLPLYQLSDGYILDEISKEDMTLVLRILKSHAALYEPDEYTLQNLYDKDLLALTQEVYTLMDKDFEEAPINEELSSTLWVMGPDLLEMPLTPFLGITLETKLNKSAEYCLEYSGGRSLLYFATCRELYEFPADVLEWENPSSSLLPDLQDKKESAAYTNAKGMLIAHSVVAYFCEEHNSIYSSECAAVEGYKLFCRPGTCPSDLIEYGMTEGILPDVQLPLPSGKEMLHRDWDFIARYYLREYYEGG